MGNIIRFPESKLPLKSLFDEKFDKESQEFPPELSKCLKEAYKRVNEQYAIDLPSFELHAGDLNDTQIEQIKAAVAQLMDNYKQRVLLMVERIIKLEAEICTLKFKLGFLPASDH